MLTNIMKQTLTNLEVNKDKARQELELNVENDILYELGEEQNESNELSNFDIDSQDRLERKSGELSEKDLKYDEVFIEENEDAKLKRNQTEIQKFMSRFKLKNPLSGFFSKKKPKIEY